MAVSGTFIGNRGGNSNGPWLELVWYVMEQDVTNNRSKVRLTLRLHSSNTLSFSAVKYGVLQGTSFTHTTGFNGVGSKQLRVMEVWVPHDADGRKSVSFSGTFDVNVTWAGSYLSRLSVSGTAVLDPIPRSSELKYFGLENPVLNGIHGTTLNYTLDKKHANYTQDITLKLGSKVIKSWTTAETGGLYIMLERTEVDEIVRGTPNSATGTLTLSVQTRNGSINIGPPVSANASYTIHPDIKPTIASVTTEIDGTGFDKSIGKYIQGLSRMTASFISTPGYGATISSEIIRIKRKSDNGNLQIISANKGTTPNVLSLGGIYVVEAEAKDSRGRITTMVKEVIVEEYVTPTISAFTANRSTPTSTVASKISTKWSSLGGNNPLTISVKAYSITTGATKTVYSTSNTLGDVTLTPNFTLQSDAESFTYTLTVTDRFGNSASADVKVGTSFIELTISKGKGIGIGKVHERGALDVKGDVYLEGTLNTTTGIGPAGIMHQFAGAVAPNGYLLCNGSAVSRTDYADLFNVIGTTYGAGDGSTTFNVPDMRGRVPVGYNPNETEFNTVSKKGGAKTHTLTTAEMPSHSHTITTLSSGDYQPNGTYAKHGGGGTYYYKSTNSVGGGGAHNNLQPYITLNYIIKY